MIIIKKYYVYLQRFLVWSSTSLRKECQNLENEVQKKWRIRFPLSSSSDEEEITPHSVVTNELDSSTTAVSTSSSEISGLTGIVKDLLKAMELRAASKHMVPKTVMPRDNMVPGFDPEDKDQNIGRWCQRAEMLI